VWWERGAYCRLPIGLRRDSKQAYQEVTCCFTAKINAPLAFCGVHRCPVTSSDTPRLFAIQGQGARAWWGLNLPPPAPSLGSAATSTPVGVRAECVLRFYSYTWIFPIRNHFWFFGVDVLNRTRSDKHAKLLPLNQNRERKGGHLHWRGMGYPALRACYCCFLQSVGCQ